ncbi:MAG TPA: transglutaminase family protein, partial [Myxococcota bacterium]|nr:transglutaminase family protein [Myxococcota bacterium]
IVLFTDVCNATFNVDMKLDRLEVKGPLSFLDHYNDHVWEKINEVAHRIENDLVTNDVRLLMGGEPTFIARDHPDAPEWLYAANGEEKLVRGHQLMRRLWPKWAKGGVVFSGLGKSYAEEEVPRFILSCYWLKNGKNLWGSPHLLADPSKKGSTSSKKMVEMIYAIQQELELPKEAILPIFEDETEEPLGFVLPLSFDVVSNGLKKETWACKQKKLYANQGTAPLGQRLPLSQVLKVLPDGTKDKTAPTALTLEIRHGNLYVFMPPVGKFAHFCVLLNAIENAAKKTNEAIVIEGYGPPDHNTLQKFHITPDPGVLEVNISPAANWTELENTITDLYAEAKAVDLSTERFLVDGRHTGTGGGNH